MQTRSTPTPRLTKNCKATDILRELWRGGKVNASSEPDEVLEMHPEFEKYAQDRFPAFFRKRISEFESKLSSFSLWFNKYNTFFILKNALTLREKGESKLAGQLNPRNTTKRAGSSSVSSPLKKMKGTEMIVSPEIEKNSNAGVHLVLNESQFVPDYDYVSWLSGDLRNRLTLIVELPTGLRLNSVYWGVLDDGATFEITLDRALELTDPKTTFKKWLNLPTDKGGFDCSHPKYIAYAQLLEERKITPVDVPKKKARFELPFSVEAKADVNIVKFSDTENREMKTVLFYADFISSDDSYKLVKPELKMEEV